MDLGSFENQLDAIPQPPMMTLEFGFYSSRRGELLELKQINAEANSRYLDEKGFSYTFEHPVYIENIEVFSAAGSRKRANIKTEVMAPDSSHFEKVENVTYDDSPVTTVHVSKLIRSFRISTGKRSILAVPVKFEGVRVTGWASQDFRQIEESAQLLSQLMKSVRQEVEESGRELSESRALLARERQSFEQSMNAQKNALTEERAQHESTLSSLKSEIREKENEVAGLEKELSDVTASFTDLTNRQQIVEDSCRKSENRLRELTDSIAHASDRLAEKEQEINIKTQESVRLTGQLQKLNSDVSLFANDMKGIAKQGDSQLRRYYWVIGVSLCLVGVVAIVSVYNTNNLIQHFLENPSIDVNSLLKLKAVYALIVASIVTALWKFASVFIAKVVQIDSRRMRLSEITMLSNTFGDEGLAELNISDEEKAKVKMNVRANLIRQYLAGEFDPEAQSKGHLIRTLSEKVAQIRQKMPELEKAEADVNANQEKKSGELDAESR